MNNTDLNKSAMMIDNKDIIENIESVIISVYNFFIFGLIPTSASECLDVMWIFANLRHLNFSTLYVHEHQSQKCCLEGYWQILLFDVTFLVPACPPHRDVA